MKLTVLAMVFVVSLVYAKDKCGFWHASCGSKNWTQCGIHKGSHQVRCY